MFDIIQASAKESGAFKAKQPVPNGKPSGLFWHSTGANNPNLNRWAGTSPKQHDLIGENVNKNSFYYSEDVCPHYVLAKGTDKKLHFAQLLPENICCWCSGEGAASTAKKNGFSGYNAKFFVHYSMSCVNCSFFVIIPLCKIFFFSFTYPHRNSYSMN